MYLKWRLQIYLLCIMCAAAPLLGKNFLDNVKDFFTINIDVTILDEVNRGIIGKMSARTIKFIIPNMLEIDDFEVADELHKRVLYAKHVKAKISLLSLLTNNIRITEALVDSPFFRYTIHNEVHNVIRVFESPPNISEKPEKESGGKRVTIEHVEVINGNYEMSHDAGVEIFAEGIVASGKFWVENGPFQVDITKAKISKGAILAGGMDLPITNLVASDLFISDKKVYTKNLVAFYETAKLTGQGTVFIDEDRYDINATLDAPKGTYPNGLTPLPFTTPALRVNTIMKGTLTEPEFAIDMTFDDTNFNNLEINKGHAEAKVNIHQVLVESANISVGHNGVIDAEGVVDIDKKNFEFLLFARDIFSEELFAFLSFTEPTKGIIKAKANISGQFADENKNVRTVATGLIENGELPHLQLMDKTRFHADIDYVFDKSITFHNVNVNDDAGLKLLANGQWDLVKNSAAFNYDLFWAQVNRYVNMPSASDVVEGLATKGRLRYANEKFGLAAPLKIERLNLARVSANKVSAKVSLEKEELRLLDITATIYDGSLQGNLFVTDIYKQRTLLGSASVRSVDIAKLKRPFTDLSIGGNLSASLNITGKAEDPLVEFISEIENTHYQKVDVGTAQLHGQVSKENLMIKKLSVMSKLGSLDGENLSLNFRTKKIAGLVYVSNLDVGGLFSEDEGRAGGDLDGVVTIDGTYLLPVIDAKLMGNKLSMFGLTLGNGPVTLALAKRPLLGNARVHDLVFSVSANLAAQSSSNIVRFAFALNHKTINTEIRFLDLELNTAELPFFTSQNVGVLGRVTGEIAAFGKISSPEFRAQLLAKEYGIFDPKIRDYQGSIKIKQGPAVLNARSKKGRLFVDLCAHLSEAKGKTTCDNPDLTLSLSGPFSTDAFVLDVNGHIDHAHVENLYPPLKKELMTLNALADVRGKITKAQQETHFAADIKISRMEASMPNIPVIKLDKPVKISIFDDALEIDNKAEFSFAPGNLTVQGAVLNNTLDIHLQGQIPLMASRFFVPIIQRANGLVKGEITLSGSVRRPIVEGKIVPEARSLITFKKWFEAMEFREGTISFVKTSTSSFRTKFDNLRLSIGDGKLLLNGIFDKRYQETEDDKSKFNLEITGSNIVLRDRLDYLEADFNINTKDTKEMGAIMKGDITVTDGSVHRQFDLRNFVAQAENNIKPGASKVLKALDLKLDLGIAVRQLRASLRMLNIDIETNLRGQLVAEGPLERPKFKGNLAVTEGAIIFPATSFDLMESQIVLDENSDRIFDPKIDIVATQELSPEDYPQIGQESTVVEFSLRGSLDRLNLGLRPIRGNKRLSQLKLFMLLLSPRSEGFEGLQGGEQGDLLRRGAKNAAATLTTEVLLRPLANELQELLEGRTKTRIQFGTTLDAAGVSLRFNWKLGPRIELQGSYAFGEDVRQREKNISWTDSQYSLADLKLKLLLFDHKPAGPLFLETSFGSVRQENASEARGKIRLKYRVLNK